MDAEINRLESQIEQLVVMFESGKAELRDLRARVAALETENRRLNGKLAVAVDRMEAILDKLPEG